MEMEKEKVSISVSEEIRITKLLRDSLKFEMTLFRPNEKEEKLIATPYIDDKNLSEKVLRIKSSKSRPHFIRISHGEKVIAVIYGRWVEGYVIAPIEAYEGKVFIKFPEGIKEADYWNKSQITMWCDFKKAVWIRPVEIILAIEVIFRREDKLQWFPVRPLNVYKEPFENFAAQEFLQQMSKNDKLSAEEIWWTLYAFHKDLSRVTGIK